MVKKLLRRLSGGKDAKGAPTGDAAETRIDEGDSGFFTTLFMEREEDTAPLVPWSERAAQLGAKTLPPAEGQALFAKAWEGDRHAAALGPDGIARLATYLGFASLPPEAELIRQDEQGDYLLIVLEGAVAVDRLQPWGGRARLGEARAGDLLGEMSLLDAGARFSSCLTLKPATLAVLEAGALDRMMADDPRLAAALLAALARRLSLRLRQSSARLSALLAQN
jgi:hypothetical protein